MLPYSFGAFGLLEAALLERGMGSEPVHTYQLGLTKVYMRQRLALLAGRRSIA